MTKLIFLWLLWARLIAGKVHSVDPKFPAGFKFGVATAAYQVEGAWNVDGKSENIWDHLSHNPASFIFNKDNGDVACDSYHRYKEDVQILKDLGVDYYRFSLSWSRILPRAVAGSPINQLGVDYYRNLLQELVDNGIEPLVTIYHWDLPEVLQDLGGWPNPELEQHFVYYARTVFEQFGDLAKLWITFNEPLQICQQGYGSGVKAPGYTSSGIADYKCGHTLIKSHARAYHTYDEEFRATQQGSVGIVTDSYWFEPAPGSEANTQAAERTLQFKYGWYINPIIKGNYPQVMIDRVAYRSEQQGYAKSRLPTFTGDEIAYIKGTYDFVGLNTYTTNYVQDIDEANFNETSYESDYRAELFIDEGWEQSASTWLRVVPWGMRKLLNWIKNAFNDPEIFITENGVSDKGELDDQQRISYFRDYLTNVRDAILEDGVNVTRYTAWSLLDNFEWARGYSEKYGLYKVDFDSPNHTRTAKASADYFKQVVATHHLINSCQ